MRNLLEQVAQPHVDLITYIYGLVDPRTGFVRYVGKANNPKYRLRMHLTPGEMKDVSHKNSWLRGLMYLGKKPELIIIQIVSRIGWQAAERKWIAHYRSLPDYPHLTNSTDGGEGVEGYVMSDEQRRKRSEIKTGIPMPPGHGDKVRAAHKGREHTPQSREHMSKGRKTWWNNLTKEERLKVIANLRTPFTEEMRKNMVIGLLNQKPRAYRYRGITKIKTKNPWRARCQFNGANVHIGSFATEIEAARARDCFILANYPGWDIILNFPSSEYDREGLDKYKYSAGPLTKANTSGYKGVHWHKQALKWQAGGYFGGKYVSCGMFHDKVEAAKAFDRMVIKLLDPLAYTNFPRDSYD